MTENVKIPVTLNMTADMAKVNDPSAPMAERRAAENRLWAHMLASEAAPAPRRGNRAQRRRQAAIERGGW
jgi:hypothetical protein